MGLQELEDLFGVLGYQVRIKEYERMFSKRNQIYLVKLIGNFFPGILVLKKGDVLSIRQEARILYSLRQKGIKVPKVYLVAGEFLLLEYIEGKNCCDLINDFQQTTNVCLVLQGLAAWLVGLHNLNTTEGKCLLKGDCNLRNFLWNGEEVYGIDFEEEIQGCPWDDVGEVCSFILNTQPAFTPTKFYLMQRFLEYYREFSQQPCPPDLHLSISLSLLKAAERRPNEEKILQQMAEKITKEGKIIVGRWGGEDNS